MDPYAVVGRLIRIWSYFDLHSRDGRIDGVDVNFFDRMIHHPGFCAQMAAVGWMQADAGGVTLPNFDRHNGGGAKTRAQSANRQSKHRKKSERDKSNAPRNGAALRGALPEERRGEEIREDQNSPKGGMADDQGVLLFPATEARDTATELAQEFAFRGGDGNSPAAIGHARAVVADLLAAGLTPEAILAEIKRPERQQSEGPWKMRDRLMPKENTNAKRTRPDPGDFDPSLDYPRPGGGNGQTGCA
jgi:hypothetical protein